MARSGEWQTVLKKDLQQANEDVMEARVDEKELCIDQENALTGEIF